MDKTALVHQMVREGKYHFLSRPRRLGKSLLVSTREATFALRFRGVIRRAYEKTGLQAVVLVDEYDKALLSAIDNPELQAGYRGAMKAFFSALKSEADYIRFVFITGVSRFGKVSIFSDLNNLQGISIHPAYAQLCGITEEELRAQFPAGVERVATGRGLALRRRIRG